MLLRLLLLGLWLWGAAQAQPVELNATPAWAGWSRPGRATEIDIRVGAAAAVQATLDVTAGRYSVRHRLELRPGRVIRVQVPLPAAEAVSVVVNAPGAPPVTREVAIAQSESPVLGSATAAGATVALDGFHAVALSAADLPRNAAAYDSIDALAIDAPTLAALDPRQIDALLAHATGCGRVVVLGAEPSVVKALQAAGGCAGQALMAAASPAEAQMLLEQSLATKLRSAMSFDAMAELRTPGPAIWGRVAAALAVYVAVAVLVFGFVAARLAAVGLPALASVALFALLQLTPPPTYLVAWAEADSGARVARHQARQSVRGVVRERLSVPLPPQLAPAALPCGSGEALHLDFDPGRAPSVAVETRLFSTASICYAGGLAVARSITVEPAVDRAWVVRNTGASGWPEGLLLAEGRMHGLPALAPGAKAIVARAEHHTRDAGVARAALAHAAGGDAGLWELDLSELLSGPVDKEGWLYVWASPR